jgi:phosphoribosylformylglycinamidine synthase
VKPENINTLGIPVKKIGTVNDSAAFTYGDVTVTMDEALAAWTKTLEKVFPTESGVERSL